VLPHENQRATLKWLQLQCPIFTKSVCVAAVEGRHLSLLRWLREQGCPWDDQCVTSAASGGNLELLRWVLKSGCPYDLENRQVTSAAAGSGNFALLQFVVERGFVLGPGTAAAAISRGDLPMLRWLREKGCPWKESDVCRMAACCGKLDVLELCHAQGGKLDVEVFLSAARRGSVPMLQWLRERGCPWHRSTCQEAATYGRLSALRWLKENGCPWPRESITSEYFAVQEWARSAN
jgi:hypothetical protein